MSFSAQRDLVKRMERMLEDRSHSSTADILLVCLDDPSEPPLPAHRCILTSASEPFRALLALQADSHASFPTAAVAGGLSAAQREQGLLATEARFARLPRLNIPGVRASTLRSVLRFLYTGHLPLSAASTIETLCAAEQFSLGALRSTAEHFLPRILREDNVCDILKTAAE